MKKETKTKDIIAWILLILGIIVFGIIIFLTTLKILGVD
jgi:uncharacterized membrane protein YiaA